VSWQGKRGFENRAGMPALFEQQGRLRGRPRWPWLLLVVSAAVVSVAVLWLLLWRSGGALSSASVGRTVVALGDSVPSGRGCECRAFPETYAATSAGRVGAVGSTVNLAVDGYTSAELRSQVLGPAARAALQTANTVVIMVGANDFLQPFVDDLDGRCFGPDCYTLAERSLSANVVETIQQIHAVHPAPVSVIVVGYWNVAQDGSVGRALYGVDGMAKADRATAHANTALQQAAADAGAHYVATFAAFRGQEGALGGWCLSPRGDPGSRSSFRENVLMTQWSCLRGES